MSFADNFNRICKERKTTPTALLKKMGHSTAKVTMWNNGSLPKESVMIDLAHELGCTVMDFFDDSPSEKESVAVGVTMIDVPAVEFALDEDEVDIIRLFRKLSRQEKHECMARVYAYEKKLAEE